MAERLKATAPNAENCRRFIRLSKPAEVLHTECVGSLPIRAVPHSWRALPGGHGGHLGQIGLRRAEIALAIDPPMGEQSALAGSLRHVSELLVELERAAEAAPLIEESLRIVRADPDASQLLLANTVRVAARVQAGLSQLEAARALWSEARALYLACEIEAGVAECDRRLAAL